MTLTRKILLIGAVLALAAASWLVSGGGLSDDTRGAASTYSTGPKGAKALYLVLEALDVKVTRWRRPLSALRSSTGALIIYDPKSLAIGKREAAKLKEWVNSGARLVIIQGTEGFGGLSGQSPDKGRRGPLLQAFGIRARRSPDTGRSDLSVTLPSVPGTLRINFGTGSRWERPSKRWIVLVEDSAGPILISRKMGKGEVLALSDATVFSNQYIRDEQNLRFALAVLLGAKRPDEIMFDEYHHGYSTKENFWSYVGSSVFSWILLQSILGLGLFFYSKRAAYAGRFRSLEPPRGRSSMEYIRAMAGVLESRMTQSAALETILARFEGQVSRRFGIPAENLERDRRPAEGAVTRPTEEAANVIAECRRAVAKGKAEGASLGLARKLAACRLKMSHAGRKRWRQLNSGETDAA